MLMVFPKNINLADLVKTEKIDLSYNWFFHLLVEVKMQISASARVHLQSIH